MIVPYTANSETLGGLGNRNPGMFQYDFAGQRPIEAFQPARKSNWVTPSFKPEFRNTDYYSLAQGEYLQQHLLRMGFKFRDMPERSALADNSFQTRFQPTRGQFGYQWNPDNAPIERAPIFRPLDNVNLKRSERISGGGSVPIPIVSAPYGLTGYSADLPDYTYVGSLFRPIP